MKHYCWKLCAVNVKLLLLPEKLNCTKISVLWDVAPYRLVVGKGKGSGKV